MEAPPAAKEVVALADGSRVALAGARARLLETTG
jgi:hypothetical protein